MSENSVLNIKGLSVGYGEKTILEGLNLNILKGDLICLMGKNGSGKSTLLKTIAGIIPPLKGEMTVSEKDFSSLTAHELSLLISIVLTERGSVDGLTVEDVVRLGRFPHTNMWGKLEEKDRRIIRESIELLNIEDIRSRRVEELSDGQLQKAFVARALAQDTPLIILDEPTSYLDISSKMELLGIFDKIAREKNKALLFSSHDWDLALEMCPKAILIDSNNNIQRGAPEEFLFKGSMQSSFMHEKFFLDGNTGRFTELRKPQKEVRFKCENQMIDQWTRHALSKIGYGVSDHASISIVMNNGEFRVEGGQQYSSLSDLLDYLKLR